jgi:hypothetical protein
MKARQEKKGKYPLNPKLAGEVKVSPSPFGNPSISDYISRKIELKIEGEVLRKPG